MDISLSTDEQPATCAHLDGLAVVQPRADVCEACQRKGRWFVHLRACLSCGHVGCCDESPGRHATAHARQTGHPIVRSLEPGEAWAWCYLDERLVALPPGHPQPTR